MNQRTNTQGAWAFPGEQTEPVGRTSHSAHSIWLWEPWLAAGKERSNFKFIHDKLAVLAPRRGEPNGMHERTPARWHQLVFTGYHGAGP